MLSSEQLSDLVDRICEAINGHSDAGVSSLGTYDEEGIVSVVGRLADSAHWIGNAITPQNAIPSTDQHGGHISSLTEAIWSASQSLSQIAHAIESVASSISELAEAQNRIANSE